jgi:hypothetical protein
MAFWAWLMLGRGPPVSACFKQTIHVLPQFRSRDVCTSSSPVAVMVPCLAGHGSGNGMLLGRQPARMDVVRGSGFPLSSYEVFETLTLPHLPRGRRKGGYNGKR